MMRFPAPAAVCAACLAAVSALALLAAPVPAAAQVDVETSPGAAVSGDPTLPDAVVAYAGPDPLAVVTGEGEVAFTVEVANTPEARTRGMMHRDSLAPDRGMLFDHGREMQLSYWMRNTLIPLDLLFIRSDGSIAKIIENAEPMSLRSLPSDVPVRAVLELAGGRAAEAGIAPGDTVRHPIFANWNAPAPDAEATSDAAADPDGAEPEPAAEPGN